MKQAKTGALSFVDLAQLSQDDLKKVLVQSRAASPTKLTDVELGLAFKLATNDLREKMLRILSRADAAHAQEMMELRCTLTKAEAAVSKIVRTAEKLLEEKEITLLPRE